MRGTIRGVFDLSKKRYGPSTGARRQKSWSCHGVLGARESALEVAQTKTSRWSFGRPPADCTSGDTSVDQNFCRRGLYMNCNTLNLVFASQLKLLSITNFCNFQISDMRLSNITVALNITNFISIFIQNRTSVLIPHPVKITLSNGSTESRIALGSATGNLPKVHPLFPIASPWSRRRRIPHS